VKNTINKLKRKNQEYKTDFIFRTKKNSTDVIGEKGIIEKNYCTNKNPQLRPTS
jgi:hypothetical protein